jgi:hypothetical protein
VSTHAPSATFPASICRPASAVGGLAGAAAAVAVLGAADAATGSFFSGASADAVFFGAPEESEVLDVFSSEVFPLVASLFVPLSEHPRASTANTGPKTIVFVICIMFAKLSA